MSFKVQIKLVFQGTPENIKTFAKGWATLLFEPDHHNGIELIEIDGRQPDDPPPKTDEPKTLLGT